MASPTVSRVVPENTAERKELSADLDNEIDREATVKGSTSSSKAPDSIENAQEPTAEAVNGSPIALHGVDPEKSEAPSNVDEGPSNVDEGPSNVDDDEPVPVLPRGASYEPDEILASAFAPSKPGEVRAALRNKCKLGPFGLTIFNLLYWPYLLVTCALLFVPAFIIFCLTFWDPKRTLLQRYTGVWGRHYLTAAPYAGVKVEGLEQITGKGPFIFVANHQSMVDILALFAMKTPFLWVSKIENFLAPFLGWNMALNGYIALRRGHLPSIMRTVRKAIRKVQGGQSLCIFPEGTRSPDGEIRSFHRGAFWLAARCKVSVVPVIIDGTENILPKHSTRISPQPVLVRVLEPIDPRYVSNKDRLLRDLVRVRMIDELAELRDTADRDSF